jgi:predicted Rossmann fold nucleotide-binding protein DprA/Smf involved in DNA uptake
VKVFTNKIQSKIYEILQQEEMGTDDLIRQLHLPTAMVMQALTQMEIQGFIKIQESRIRIREYRE